MNGNMGVIAGVRVSHDHATLDDIEAARLGSDADAVGALLDEPGVREAFVVQTCHRVEGYVVADDESTGDRALAAVFGDAPVVGMNHEASLRHLLRVAAGLESVVLGEDQIMGQLRDAFEGARAADAIGPVLREAVTKALHVGERARNETTINEGVVSLGSAATRLADRETGLAGASALVVGAGEMGALAAKAFDASDAENLVVANRTVTHAEWVLEELETASAAVSLDALSEHVASADVVVTATGSDDPVVTKRTVQGAGETFLVDLGQPRDVAPAVSEVEDVSVRDLDDIEAVTEATRDKRADAAREVERIVTEEFERLLAQYKRKRADEVIATMYESAERLKARELDTAFSKLDAEDELSDDQRETVEALADSLVSQILAAPTRSLRDAAEDDDWQTIATALELFDPDLDGSSPLADADPSAWAAAETEDD
ncbi:glutamyl-tRNA reductase [Salarchaeum sp. III]|uniref:glutamyl-tRNA reductase n=1 Tax=Salarchaeum sp. III TaxID=3107927 RepID=UPI002ED89EC1